MIRKTIFMLAKIFSWNISGCTVIIHYTDKIARNLTRVCEMESDIGRDISVLIVGD